MASKASPSPPPPQRKANGLERLFLQLDVRTYAVLFFPALESAERRQAAAADMRAAVALPRLGSSAPDAAAGAPALLRLAPPGAGSGDSGGGETESAAAWACAEAKGGREGPAGQGALLAAAEALVAGRPNSPFAPALTQHTWLASADGRVGALLVDINHAAADGRGLVAYVARLAAALGSPAAGGGDHADGSLLPRGLPRDVSERLPDAPPPLDPVYVPLPGSALTAAEVRLVAVPREGGDSSAGGKRQGDQSEGHGEPPLTLHAEVEPAVPALLAACRREGATLTGLLAAAFQVALVERAAVAEVPLADRCAAVSVLVDARPLLRPAVDGDGAAAAPAPDAAEDQAVAVAVGTVTLGASAALAGAADAAGDANLLRQRLLALAAAATRELQQRIARGEAAAQARALAAGRWGDGPPSAAVEISNLGALTLPAGCHARFGQRFDAYRGGVSVLVHSEGSAGPAAVAAGEPQAKGGRLHLAASPGRDVEHGAASALLARVNALLRCAADGGP